MGYLIIGILIVVGLLYLILKPTEEEREIENLLTEHGERLELEIQEYRKDKERYDR